MKNFVLIACILLTLSACNTKNKEAILLVTFGSSYEAPHKTFKNIDSLTKAKYPNYEIRWAYTANFVIKKLREGRGEGAFKGQPIVINNPEEALKQLLVDGYNKINVQSLHIIPGDEFSDLQKTASTFAEANSSSAVSLGTPLLTSDKDIKDVAAVLADKFSSQAANGPVILMGHGTPHAADAKYDELHAELQKINSNFHIGTVEGIGFGEGDEEGTGPLAIGSLIEQLKAMDPQPTNVTITPLMSIAGDHANNDMNANTGESDPMEQSWRERLEAEGYTVNCIMKGLGDYDEINTIWMNHLDAVK